MNDNINEYYTVKEIAEILYFSDAYVRELLVRGELKGVKIRLDGSLKWIAEKKSIHDRRDNPKKMGKPISDID